MKTFLLAALLGVFCFVPDMRADFLLAGSQNGLGASANFSVSNGALVITLTDTSTKTATTASQVLTGVYFNLKNGTPNPSFSSPGASAPAGTVAIDGNTQNTLGSATSANTAWGFDKGLAGTPFSMQYGFISTALTSSCVGAACGKTISGSDLKDTSVYGGLVNQGGSGVNQWVDHNSVIFTLNLPQNTTFTTASIANVAFQFGDAALTEMDFQVLPEPVTYSGAILLLLIPLVWLKRKHAIRHEV